jgi:CDP-glucose 4,6-dehydratase
MHFLITGHTGFKGSWLSMMLMKLGHRVSGISIECEKDSLFQKAELSREFLYNLDLDIRKGDLLPEYIARINPDVIVHLAAQPLVRKSYKDPIETFETNVMGTLNVLEASRRANDLQFLLVVTTDKVYKRSHGIRFHKEDDPLGGDDPYSASKAAADIASQSWIKNFATCPIAIARSGNVIGGGDWATDRLLPDLVSAAESSGKLVLRNPLAIRPWQHVLDCLNGYLTLIDFGIRTNQGGVWNFGPKLNSVHSVEELVHVFKQKWSGRALSLKVFMESDPQRPETGALLLDSNHARMTLAWDDKLDFEASIEWTVDWFKKVREDNPREVSLDQIDRFLRL